MEMYTVKRDGQVDIQFNGELLAEADNLAMDGPRSSRWTDIEIYRTEGGKYITQVVGVTLWQGEQNRYCSSVCDTAQDVVQALYCNDEYGGAWLSAVAKDALERAALVDDAFAPVVVEAIK